MASGSGDVVGNEPAGPAGDTPFEWRVTPWRREPLKAAVTIGIMLAAILLSWWYSGGEFYFAVLALLILWGSLGPFFVTTRFVIDAEGVEVDSSFLKRRRKWSEIRAWYVDRHGATLSPFAGRSWLESYRAVRVLFGDHEERVRNLLNEKLGQPARS
jgi:hypothetical protein